MFFLTKDESYELLKWQIWKCELSWFSLGQSHMYVYVATVPLSHYGCVSKENVRKRKRRCKECNGCKAENCGTCRYCLNPKLKRICVQRACLNYILQ